MKKSIIFISILSLFIGCASSNINISQYKTIPKSPIIVPNICKKEYSNLIDKPKVAILKWSNNSNFGVAKVSTNSSNGGAFAGLMISPTTGIGGGYLHHNTKNSVVRVVKPKLDKAITSAIEGILSQIGGVRVYTRTDLSKLIKEQKLEHSGLFNNNTIIQFGKLSGVQYIITGSIDAVNQKYRDYAAITGILTSATKTKTTKELLAKLALNAGAIMASGMRVTTTMTFKVIDASTGQIIFSKQLSRTTNIGRYPKPTYTQIIGAIKTDMLEAGNSIKTELAKLFPIQGYIIQLKKYKNDYIALINVGSADGVVAGEKFNIYNFDVLLDPIKHTQLCEKYSLNAKLIVSKNQIQPHSAWAIVTGDDVNKIQPGDLIKSKGQ